MGDNPVIAHDILRYVPHHQEVNTCQGERERRFARILLSLIHFPRDVEEWSKAVGKGPRHYCQPGRADAWAVTG